MRSRSRWVISAMSVLVVMGALGFGRFGYTMILPPMQSQLLLSNLQVGDLAAANMTGYLFLSVLGGFLAARFGARGVIGVSLIVVAASMGLTGLAAGYRGAVVGRFLTGIGSGGANVPIMGLLVAWYRPQRRGLAAGIAVSGSSFGLLITGVMIPVILRHYERAGWRVSWYVLAAATFVIAILALALLRNSPEDGPEEIRVAPSGWKEMGRLFRSLDVWRLSVIYLTFGFSYVIYATFFVKGLTTAGFNEASAGRLWSGIGAASIASGFLWGMISDRISRRYALALIYTLQAASFLLYGIGLMTRQFDAGYYLSAALFALTAWSIPAVMSAAAGDLFGPRIASAAFGIITLFFGVGQVFGPFVAGRLADAAGSYGSAFLLASGVAALGAVLSAVFIPSSLSYANRKAGGAP